MSATTEARTFTVALIGNPNTGKSTLFTGLVGVRQHVGNYPGVTVEKKTGRMRFAGRQFELIDLPGLYSLAPRSRDEMVAVDLLVGRRDDVPPVDAVLCIVDAGNLQRNLYLVSQVLELGLPTVLAVNMLDVAEDHGIRIDLKRLEQRLGIPVAAIQANRRLGLGRLKTALAGVLACGAGVSPARKSQAALLNRNETPLPEAFEAEVRSLEAELAAALAAEGRPAVAAHAWCDGFCWMSTAICSGRSCRAARNIGRRGWRRAAPVWWPRAAPCPRSKRSPATIGPDACSKASVTEPHRYKVTGTDRIDRVLTHGFWGMLVFAVVMLIVFQAVFVGRGRRCKRFRPPRRRPGAGSRPTWPREPCGACWSAAWWAAWAACWPSCRKSSSSSPSWPCWKTAATWPAAPASWTASCSAWA